MNANRHLFLTGEPQAGKTTLINRLLARHPGWAVKGFCTYMECTPGYEAIVTVYIAPITPCDWYRKEEALAGIRLVSRREAFPGAFDRVGARILRESVGADLVIMDELGFLENEALAFQQTVLETLQGETPVLGVIKPTSTPFLDLVRGYPHVHILAVNPDDREDQYLKASRFVAAAVQYYQASQHIITHK
ncbi:MAG: nucleoside-triphosphatase [Eubacteriales bacterium]|nr:nucleoside-triphosphatase [Eubacteriales bacterium]